LTRSAAHLSLKVAGGVPYQFCDGPDDYQGFRVSVEVPSLSSFRRGRERIVLPAK
jgi:hypothetical protein